MHATQIDSSTLLIFEKPLNETTRICLRLEQLLDELYGQLNHPETTDSKTALLLLLRLMNTVERPDIKSKLTQTLTQYTTALNSISQFDHVDKDQLQTVLNALNQHINNLHLHRGKLVDALRQNEFLNSLRLQLANPSGPCFDASPAFALWVQTPQDHQVTELKGWLSHFSQIENMIETILQLIRKSADIETVTATQGYYQQNLNPNIPCEMIRIALPKAHAVFPEFSAGKHRLCIRFLNPNYQTNGKPSPTQQNIEFELSCCRI